MTKETFKLAGITFLDVPHARDLANECITEDCYELRGLEGRWRVLDLGACFGEFSLYASSLGHCSVPVEASEYSFRVCSLNFRNNQSFLGLTSGPIRAKAVGGGQSFQFSDHYFRPDHPAGSGPVFGEGSVESVMEMTVNTLIQSPVFSERFGPLKNFVKIDIEGGEVGLFRSPGWLDLVQALSMETHNHDADLFGGILEAHGFTVKLLGTGPFPRPMWDKSMTAGLVIARR